MCYFMRVETVPDENQDITLLIGSTGPMGRAVLRIAGESGARVRAFARTPDALADTGAEVVRGDVLDPESLVRALRGVTRVVCVLGSRPGKSGAHLLSDGTRNLVSAMQETAVSRLVIVTGMGAGSSRGHGPLWYDALVRPTILRGVYADKEQQEEIVRASALDWTIVRPAVLVAKPQIRPVVAKAELARREKMGSLTRDDVARFLIPEATSPKFLQQTVHLYTGTPQ